MRLGVADEARLGARPWRRACTPRLARNTGSVVHQQPRRWSCRGSRATPARRCPGRSRAGAAPSPFLVSAWTAASRAEQGRRDGLLNRPRRPAPALEARPGRDQEGEGARAALSAQDIVCRRWRDPRQLHRRGAGGRRRGVHSEPRRNMHASNAARQGRALRPLHRAHATLLEFKRRARRSRGSTAGPVKLPGGGSIVIPPPGARRDPRQFGPGPRTARSHEESIYTVNLRPRRRSRGQAAAFVTIRRPSSCAPT